MFTKRAHGFSKRICQVFPGLITLVLICLTGCASTLYQSSSNVQAEVDDVQYLSSYGEWLDVPPFGMAWRPDVVSGWEPFYYGHWIWTNDGWAWTSYEPYGWLVYHYGYWGYKPGLGWFWVPEDIWWPARVQWYTFGDYAAWAPLPPPSIVWPDPWDSYDINIWIVVDIDKFTNENIGRHRIRKLVSRGTIQRQNVIKRAPDRQHVERVSKKAVTTIRVRKQETNIQPRADSTPPTSVRRREPKLRKMVLPKTERSKVEKHAPQVEHKILTSRKKAPAQSEKSPEKNVDTKRKRK